MIRLVGVDLPKNKKILYALTHLYGIGLAKARTLIMKTNINSNTYVYELTLEQTALLRETLEKSQIKIEGDLRRFTELNIKRLIEINSYRGKRHKKNLPVRGQRTRTNARTLRGVKKTVTNKKK